MLLGAVRSRSRASDGRNGTNVGSYIPTVSASTATSRLTVSYHFDDEREIYLADVIVAAQYRGNDYGSEGLKLLCDAAKENGVVVLHDVIAIDNPAIGMFLKTGFTEEYRTYKIIMLRKELATKLN